MKQMTKRTYWYMYIDIIRDLQIKGQERVRVFDAEHAHKVWRLTFFKVRAFKTENIYTVLIVGLVMRSKGPYYIITWLTNIHSERNVTERQQYILIIIWSLLIIIIMLKK